MKLPSRPPPAVHPFRSVSIGTFDITHKAYNKLGYISKYVVPRLGTGGNHQEGMKRVTCLERDRDARPPIEGGISREIKRVQSVTMFIAFLTG